MRNKLFAPLICSLLLLNSKDLLAMDPLEEKEEKGKAPRTLSRSRTNEKLLEGKIKSSGTGSSDPSVTEGQEARNSLSRKGSSHEKEEHTLRGRPESPQKNESMQRCRTASQEKGKLDGTQSLRRKSGIKI